MNNLQKRLLPYGLLIGFGLAAPFLFPAYQSQIAELWLLMVMALAWDLIGGQMGYNSFGNVLFLGVGMYAGCVFQIGLYYDVGAYSSAMGGGTHFIFNEQQYFTGLFLSLPVAAMAAAITAALLGSFILAMRGHYFAICTLGLGIAAGELASGWEWIGAGSGLTVPDPPNTIHDPNTVFYFMALILLVCTLVLFNWLYSTRFGLAINAIRDNEDKAEAMGLPTIQIKVIAWIIAAIALGMTGVILGNIKKFIDPIDVAFSGATFGVWMILMAILGGKGTLWGPIIGAVVFQVMKELFWTYLLGWQRVALGLLIIAIVVFFPMGIMGWLKHNYPHWFGPTVSHTGDTNSKEEPAT